MTWAVYLSLNKLIRVRFSRDVYSRFSRVLHGIAQPFVGKASSQKFSRGKKLSRYFPLNKINGSINRNETKSVI